MQTFHHLYFENSQKMRALQDQSIDLVVTSPPYPMIEMWDTVFFQQKPAIRNLMAKGDGRAAFEAMHLQLDSVWQEVFRVLKPGGIACINIGDAVRTIRDRFALYANHSRILAQMLQLGFSALPAVLWRKQTNAPNKFMGSGMMPPGAYVTLEHEFVLVLRKGDKRLFPSAADKQLRRQSAYFWEERNVWFSDVWMDLKGTTQHFQDSRTRSRSGAFPFELAYRLINMFSVQKDVVLDPFLGTGTTLCAAMASGRNSVGYEIDAAFSPVINSGLAGNVPLAVRRTEARLEAHCEFVESHFKKKGPFKHCNAPYRFPVVTRQETDLLLQRLKAAEQNSPDQWTATYVEHPEQDFSDLWQRFGNQNNPAASDSTPAKKRKKTVGRQESRFE